MAIPKIKKVYKEINRGGFGIVESVLTEYGRVARKTFNPRDSENLDSSTLDKLRKRFIQEVIVQEQLPPSSVIPILGYDLSGENPWFLMPIAGRVYEDEIYFAREEERPPEGLSDILNAMEVIHGLGYVHRDIKPQNILFHEGRWKLSDFGLISSDATILTSFSTSTGDKGGTEQYMAPEQYREFKKVKKEADIYSFGAILHDIFENGKRTPYDELTGRGEIGFIINKCTKRNPRQRFRSIPKLRSMLLTALESYGKQIQNDEAEWIAKLESYLEWDEEQLEQFIFGVEKLESKRAVFMKMDKDRFQHFFDIDSYLWVDLITLYLDWINESEFLYDFCDVLIGRIRKVYDIAETVDVKADCVLAAAELGASHNRWYVMHRVIKMAEHNIDDNLAQRICIELKMDEKLKEQFNVCIDQISLTPDRCHPLIAELFK
ncbi:MAG: protein kinase [Crocinitomicaceae bacterium]|nr:protein kinase [Flavobacteriales bacterium]NQZ38340.1 protein kinase [Crocinitomicaceae bacterium]